MLQQTQVVSVIDYFSRFIQHFPDIKSLAEASQDEVLHLWTGLGYYARARNLHKAAQIIQKEFAGRFPEQIESVLTLPGIGRSTAAAILAQALGQRHAILDGNVKRVLTRYHAIEGWPGNKQTETLLWNLAEAATPSRRLADYTQAIMDLGATVCGRKPECTACPLANKCLAKKQGNATDYPTPKARKTLPIRQTSMLILQQDSSILLQQRPPSGIWGSLWSLPECPLDKSVETYCQTELGLQVEQLEACNTLQHRFSHYQLDIIPIYGKVTGYSPRVMEEPGRIWYNTTQPQKLGLPTPVKKLIQHRVKTP
jgi:A/G-specific adenine glycosylase